MGRRNHDNTPKPGGRRQAKLAARAAEREALAAPARPFAGVAGECDLVAMREFVPSATATLAVPGTDRTIRVATVLPGAIPALVRDTADGPEAFVALQTQSPAADPARELAAAITWARDAAPGSTLAASGADASTPPLTEVVDPAAPLDVEVHGDFAWWVAPGTEVTPAIAQAVQNANSVMMPSARVAGDGIEAAWWVDTGDRAHIRWVRPEDEDVLFEALARVHAAGALTLGEGSRFAGSFRTDGLLVPVFDLDRERHAQEWAEGLASLDAALAAALAATEPLTSSERSSRDGLRARQVTLR